MAINPQVLRWARETAGYDLAEAARRIGLRDARGDTAEDRLADIEAGDAPATPAVLRRMAKQYRRPLVSLYLPNIPRRSDVGQDFRSLPAQGDPSDTLLQALLRDVKAGQALVRDALEDNEEAQPLAFVNSMTVQHGVAAVANSISEHLLFERAEFRAANGAELGFNNLRAAAERAGVFVVLAGNLGSWQTSISVKVFRGFAIADPLAPFVVINDQDARPAWSFTLLHELAHLWLGASGISGASPTVGLERFCNDVAARVLLSPEELNGLILTTATPLVEADALISQFARTRNLSRSMVAYQLFRQGRLTEERWRQFTDRFQEQWAATRAQQREVNRDVEGGPNYYVVKRHRLGGALIDLVRRGLANGSLTPTRAARMLGVKPMSVYPLIAAPQRAGAA